MATSTTQQKAKEITPVYCCTIYFVWIILPIVVFLFATGLLKVAGEQRCYLELFTHSVSVVSNSTANANVSTADWSFGFVATSPVTSCKISLYTIKSRLLRGQEIVAESSPSLGFFGQFAASYRPDWTITNLGFENVVTPEVMGDVVWNVRVEIVARMKKDAKFRNGHRIIMSRYGSHQVDDFLMVVCRDIPVKFTVDSTGNKMGSLLGNMRRCDYTTVDNFDDSDYWNYNN